ncbi:hypothetical protein GBAR_LOCUS26335, partial [Geodia barretti]
MSNWQESAVTKTVIELMMRTRKDGAQKVLNADLGWRNLIVDNTIGGPSYTTATPPTIRGSGVGLSARCVGSVIDPPHLISEQ